jgi:hypothetical protein
MFKMLKSMHATGWVKSRVRRASARIVSGSRRSRRRLSDWLLTHRRRAEFSSTGGPIQDHLLPSSSTNVKPQGVGECLKVHARRNQERQEQVHQRRAHGHEQDVRRPARMPEVGLTTIRP